MYILIYNRKIFEVRNLPLNRYASVLANALYCAKFGCYVGSGAEVEVLRMMRSFKQT